MQQQGTVNPAAVSHAAQPNLQGLRAVSMQMPTGSNQLIHRLLPCTAGRGARAATTRRAAGGLAGQAAPSQLQPSQRGSQRGIPAVPHNAPRQHNHLVLQPFQDEQRAGRRGGWGSPWQSALPTPGELGNWAGTSDWVTRVLLLGSALQSLGSKAAAGKGVRDI